MAVKRKRFTVSLTDDLNQRLTKVYQEEYSHSSKSDMLRDLIARGLSLQQNNSQDNCISSGFEQSKRRK